MSSSSRSNNEITSLFNLSICALVKHPEYLSQDQCQLLPETIAIRVFEGLFLAGKLNPRLLRLFQREEWDDLSLRIENLGLDSWTPPTLKYDSGYKSVHDPKFP